ncbi:MAG: DMT family transporter [Kofleriaceae bacterium]
MKRGLAMVALAACGWGLWSLFLIPTHLSALVTTPIVYLVMGVVGLAFTWMDPAPTWNRAAVGWVIAFAVTDVINCILFFEAMNHTTIAIAVLTHYSAPILIALAAPYVDGVITRGARPAAVVAMAGIAIVLEPWRAPADGAVLGALLGFGSATMYAANVFCARRLGQTIGPARAIAYHGLIGALVAAPFAIHGFDAVTFRDLEYLVSGGALVGAGAGILFVAGLSRVGAGRAAVLTFAEPIVAVLVGAVHWGQPLRPIAAVGGALVLAAGVHVARRSHGKQGALT